MTLAVLMVAEVPDAAAEIDVDETDAERLSCASHGVLRESPRHKTPQTAPQKGNSGTIPEKQIPAGHWLMARGQAGKRRGGEKNPAASQVDDEKRIVIATLGSLRFRISSTIMLAHRPKPSSIKISLVFFTSFSQTPSETTGGR